MNGVFRDSTSATALKFLERLVSRFGGSEDYAGDVVETLLDMVLEIPRELERVSGTPEGEATGIDRDEFPFRGMGTLESLLRVR